MSQYSDTEDNVSERNTAGPSTGVARVTATRPDGAAAGGAIGGNSDASQTARALGTTAAFDQQWNSPLCDCCCERSNFSDHMFAYFCPCFAIGVAKSHADTSSALFNACCFPAVCVPGVYGLVRIGYGITGAAQSDCLAGALAPLCAVRRLYTETRSRGDEALWVGDYGSNAEEWQEEMGSFHDCRECARSIFCPCFVAHEIHTRLQMHSPMPTNKWLDVFCLLPCSMYGQTRITYGIAKKDCFCEDCCCGGFFYPCGLNRALREASRREMTMRQRAYVSGAGAAGKTRLGLRAVANATETALKVVSGEKPRAVSAQMV